MNSFLLIEKFCAGLAQSTLILKFSYYFTVLFSSELFVFCYIAAFLTFGLLVFRVPIENRYDFYDKVFDFFAKLGFVFLVFVIVYAFIKIFSAVPRPNNINDLRSFPSAHAGLAVILAFHFYKYFSRAGVTIFVFLILINAFVLLVLSCHSTIDIICGTLFAPFTRILGIWIYNCCSSPIRFLKGFVYKLLIAKK
jgi:membrane-associated phospholipid phosphatase